MTPPSAPMEQPEGMELGGSFNEQRGKHGESHGDQAAGNYAQRVSPMEQGYSPQPLQPHELSMQTTTSILRQQRENYMRIANFVLRCAALLFSFLSFVIMAANKQNNPTMKFDDYEEYRYCLSIGVLAFVYSAFQLFKAIYDIVIGYTIIPEIVSSYMDFICDQIFAYLLMSCASAAAPITTRMRENGDTKFTDMAAASVSMAFFGFVVVAASSLLSGFNLCRHIIW